jgi:hypothetical protein
VPNVAMDGLGWWWGFNFEALSRRGPIGRRKIEIRLISKVTVDHSLFGLV